MLKANHIKNNVVLIKKNIKPLLVLGNSYNQPLTTITRSSSKRERDNHRLSRIEGGTYYHEKIILGYSRSQMCNLVYDVAKYKEFVPFCVSSTILSELSEPGKLNLTKMNRNNLSLNMKNFNNNIDGQGNLPKSMRAKLEIGYPPIQEEYVSHVTSVHPNYVNSVSKDTYLFKFLINEWKFHPNPLCYDIDHLNSMSDSELNKGIEESCMVEFFVSFKFNNSLYNSFSEIFMDKIFKKMIEAFTKRASVLYGKPSMLPKSVN